MTLLSNITNRRRLCRFALLLIAVVGLGIATMAQTTAQPPNPSAKGTAAGTDTSSDDYSDTDAAPHVGLSAIPNSAVAIDGSGLLPLDKDAENTWAIATGFFGGYDSALLQTKGLNSGIAGNELDIAALLNGKRGVFLLQNSTTTTSLFHNGVSVVALNRTSLDFVRELSQRWTWTARGSAGYGNDMVRALTSPDSKVIDTIAVPDAQAAAYSIHTGKDLTSEVATTLHLQKSRSSEWGFSVSNSYQNYPELNSSINTSLGRADYIRTLTRSFSQGLYGMLGKQTGSLDCTVGGGGYQALFHPGKKVEMEAGVAPLVGTTGCGRTFQFSADFNFLYQATPQTSFYVTGERQLNTGVLQNSIWLNTATAGIRHSFTSKLDLRIDGGGFEGKSTIGNNNYSNSFISAGLRHALSAHIDQEVSFRRYFSTGFPSTPDRTFILFTLWITPDRNAQGRRY